MFWKGRVSFFNQLDSFLKQSEVSLASIEQPVVPDNVTPGGCRVGISKLKDVAGISKLLNDWFEDPSSKTKADTSPEWIRKTYLENEAIWIVARDSKGTIRGCVSSFRIKAPYPNSISSGCGKSYPWGVVDWYCVHPLWRSKGLGSVLLEILDLVTYRIGRKAHIFLKEGYPLPLPHVPVFSTWLLCRKAGSPLIKEMDDDTGLTVYPYHEVERETRLPLVRIEGLPTKVGLSEWEDALDNSLPECWVFVSCSSEVDYKRGWKTDSLVSMYAFRWHPGKWLGSRPAANIL
jgi:GNAT superfamily N-acetyltransferase